MAKKAGSPASRPGVVRAHVLALMLSGAFIGTPAAAENYIVYVGSYTAAPSAAKGIYAERFDSDTGKITPIGLVAETVNPAYLTGTPDGRFLYAPNWDTPEAETGALDTVTAYGVNKETGALSFLNKVSSGGELPNQSLVDPSGKVLISVNYGLHVETRHSASVAASQILPNGALSEPFYIDIHPNDIIKTKLPARDPQGVGVGAHGHGIAFTKDSRFVFIADLGLDRVFTYKLDPNHPAMSMVGFVHAPADSGPRRLVVSPNDEFVYCATQDSSQLLVYRVGKDGTLKELQQLSTLPPDYKGRNGVAEIAIDKQGHYIYVSNRGADSLAVYKVDPKSGVVTYQEDVKSLGKSPRNLRFDPTGKYLFVTNQMSDNLIVFKADPNTGHLSAVDQTVTVPQAAGITFVNTDK